jgi:hypothetical protein
MLSLIVIGLWIAFASAVLAAVDAFRRDRRWRCLVGATLAIPSLLAAGFLSWIWGQNPANDELFFSGNFGFSPEWICSSNRGNFTDLVCVEKPAVGVAEPSNGATDATQSN